MKIDNRSFEVAEEFKYLGTTLTVKILFRKKLRAMWYNAPTMLPAGGRQHRRCIIPQTVTHSLVLL